MRMKASVRIAGLLLVLLGVTGCASRQWLTGKTAALSSGISKEELVDHINQNISGSDSHPGLAAWRSSRAQVRVSQMPVPVPASIAVEAPRHFRLVASNPMGSQEVDIGSNDEVLWIWTKGEPTHVLTVAHADVPLAMKEMQMPVEIHPDWLMQVFGVVPLRAQDFKMEPVQGEPGLMQLVAEQQSSFGQDVQRVVRVDLKSGHVVEHCLRLPGGKVMVRAKLEQYEKLASGTELPGVFRLQWPDAMMEMAIHVRDPEVNPVSLRANKSLWEVPVQAGREVVDMGAIARRKRMPQQRKVYEGLFEETAGTVRLTNGEQKVNAPRPKGFPNVAPAVNESATAAEAPEWARGG